MHTLLIVDDEQIEREALKYVVERECERIQVVDVAVNGRDAIEKVKQYRPDILFMDIKMPGINGLEAAEQIKEIHKDCKIIFISAFDYFHYAQKAILVGAIDFILKPVSNEQVVESIKRATMALDMERRNKQKEEKWDESSLSSFTEKNHDQPLQMDKSAALVEKICEYINENYATEITLKDMASMVNYNIHYFSKMFKLYKKQNFIDYITSVRVAKAKELLSSSQLSIKEVGWMVGYDDQNYFTRVFKRIEKITPSEYRDKIMLIT